MSCHIHNALRHTGFTVPSERGGRGGQIFAAHICKSLALDMVLLQSPRAVPSIWMLQCMMTCFFWPGFVGKEYCKADSRYCTRDAFTIVMEWFTACVEGPACMLAAYGIVQRASWKHMAVILVVFGELYGAVLYLASAWFEGESSTLTSVGTVLIACIDDSMTNLWGLKSYLWQHDCHNVRAPMMEEVLYCAFVYRFSIWCGGCIIKWRMDALRSMCLQILHCLTFLPGIGCVSFDCWSVTVRK